ncbi:hypothetical protein C8J57DRAFT_1480261 [Mycena rebaudengoi]|nr:hypothetical protein C8J57DRAFT_1480261 [Mycena rebaudengoi]
MQATNDLGEGALHPPYAEARSWRKKIRREEGCAKNVYRRTAGMRTAPAAGISVIHILHRKEGYARPRARDGYDKQGGISLILHMRALPAQHPAPPLAEARTASAGSVNRSMRDPYGFERHSAARLAARAITHPQAARTRAGEDGATRIRQSVVADRPSRHQSGGRRRRNGTRWQEASSAHSRSMTPMAGSRRWRGVAEKRRWDEAGAQSHRSCPDYKEENAPRTWDWIRWHRRGPRTPMSDATSWISEGGDVWGGRMQVQEGGRKELEDGLGRWDEVVVRYIPPPAERPVALRQAAATVYGIQYMRFPCRGRAPRPVDLSLKSQYTRRVHIRLFRTAFRFSPQNEAQNPAPEGTENSREGDMSRVTEI